MPDRLPGQVILNTRPAHQQAELTALLEAEGASVLSFPVIEIAPLDARVIRQSLARDMTQYDILLFVSRNAVEAASRVFDEVSLPSSMQFGVIGAATRSALTARVGELGTRLISSEPYNSEALLSAAALQEVTGKSILILRGQEGRNLLGDELSARGALVEYCEVYRRRLPQRDTETFEQLVAAAFPTLVILTSNEGMHNLITLVASSSAQRLCKIPWLLISERMRESALKLGHNAPIIIARSASGNGIQQTICDWVDQHKPGQQTPTTADYE